MPLYDFKCDKCNKKQEIFISIEDYENSIVFCDECDDLLIRDWNAGSPMVGVYSMSTTEQRREILKKRSKEHSKKNIEKFHEMNKQDFKP